MSAGTGKSALVVVREPTRGRKIKEALATYGITVLAGADDPVAALPQLEEREPTLLVVELDPATSTKSGVARNERILEFVQLARNRLPGLKVIAVMESVDVNFVAEAAAKGIDAYVLGPQR